MDVLKQRAALMGIKHSNNISVAALKAKIEAKLAGEEEAASADESQDEAPAAEQDAATASAATGPKIAPKKVQTLREFMHEREMKLIRLRITNLDPKKASLPGEIFTFANEVLGGVRKYVPYGEVTDNGYHVPFCIYKQLRDREFLSIKIRKGNNGREVVETSWVREFALEILPPLTEVELARLAASQAAAGGLE
ncbi:hypothetical protein X766_15860 [Mesorhizobium sp. LSJC255A00]|nr:hypothetical protein X766_15860 [Mesorhizobium sp. LSJC255A00]